MRKPAVTKLDGAVASGPTVEALAPTARDTRAMRRAVAVVRARGNALEVLLASLARKAGEASASAWAVAWAASGLVSCNIALLEIKMLLTFFELVLQVDLLSFF